MSELNTRTDESDIEREKKAAADIAYILRALGSEDAKRRALTEEALSKLELFPARERTDE